MTKEHLYRALCEILKPNEYYIRCQLDAFFESSICIPKGTNRHANADALHQYAEGSSIQQLKFNKWIDDKHPTFCKDICYRIKPSEPIYEYIWEYPSNDISLITPNYMTVEEVEKIGIKLWCNTETKRIRV